MSVLFWRVLLGISSFGLVSSSVFLFLVVIAAARFKRCARQVQRSVLKIAGEQLPPVTILKPLLHSMHRL